MEPKASTSGSSYPSIIPFVSRSITTSDDFFLSRQGTFAEVFQSSAEMNASEYSESTWRPLAFVPLPGSVYCRLI
ncbi:hypothetical protein PILCRDRAFT_825448 [Piloderma croceum F 1598]|uniref:Uncharacterized protein n=1 Tax=Piloderma croceum (strain F 1598) TaxID=765440 RepID=A0A0C3BIV1_PILCF|nr:hypothetical protein PILCRDRAFT_825448 [Piloderma croceum F 1598]